MIVVVTEMVMGIAVMLMILVALVAVVIMMVEAMVTGTSELSAPPSRSCPRARGWVVAVPPSGWILCADAGHAAASAEAQGQVSIPAAEPAGGPPRAQR